MKKNYVKNYKQNYEKVFYPPNIRLPSILQKVTFYDHLSSPRVSFELFLVLFVSYHASSKVKKFVQLVVGDKIRTVWW